MRCPRCNFENIPGRTRCFKCDSILTTSEKAEQVNPPRMANWKKPFRGISRLIRKQRFIPDVDLSLWWQSHPELGKLTGLFLDLIPGLGHLIAGCFKNIWWIFLTWFLLIFLGIFFIPSTWGFMFLGFAIGTHTWILMRHNVIKDIKRLRDRLVVAILFVVLLFTLYRVIPRIVLPNLNGAYSTLTISENNIEPGDYFLATRNYEKVSLNRGSLVIIRPHIIGQRSSGTTVGQIVALPGERIELKDDSFVVNDQKLDNNKYPVPRWLHNRKILFIISQGSYFVTSNYNVTERGRNLNNSDISGACIYKTDEIQAKVFMRWYPLSKRAFIK